MAAVSDYTPIATRNIKRQAQLIEMHGQIIPTDSVLELGRVTEAITKLISKTGCDLTTFQQADAQSLPFNDNVFDLVYGIHVLMYTNYNKALSEIYRVLKPSGRIAFIEISKLTPTEASFYPEELYRACRDTGFSGIEVIPLKFKWDISIEQLNSLLKDIPVIREAIGNYLLIAEKNNENN